MEYKLKVNEQKELIKTKDRTLLIRESEFDKQKALMNQKSQCVEKAIEEAKKKDKENNVLISTFKKEQLARSKDSITKLSIILKLKPSTQSYLKQRKGCRSRILLTQC